MINKYSRTALATIVLLSCGTSALSQVAVNPTREDVVELVSDQIDNATSEFASVFVGTVESPGAATIRLRVGDYNLGRESYVTLTSVTDGDVQRLDAQSIAQSYNWSVTFNGDSVDVDLYVAPGDVGVYVAIDRLRAPLTLEAEPSAVASICGANDDRVASNDPRVGRTTQGCTAWLVSNGAVLTAGHCPFAAGDTVDFNLPPSLANGNPIAPAAANQYPVNIASIMSENSGVGQDWLVLALNANTTTLRTAHNVQGFFRMTRAIPGNGTVLRVTGCGLDNSPGGAGGSVCNGGTNHNGGCVNNANCPGGGVCTPVACCDPDGTGAAGCGNNCNAASQTQQTHTGTLVSSTVDRIQHSMDTMPANSGSPIIWEANGLTIGIHTAGGCTSTGGSNNGTRFSRAVLETAIRNFAGPNPVYVDASDYSLPSNGGVFEPLHSLSEAVNAVLHGGTISLVPGHYTTNNPGNIFTAGADGKAMTIVSPAGSSFIGG